MLRIGQSDVILRDETRTDPAWSYTAEMRVSDGILGAYYIEVAQISDRCGPGLFRRIEIDG